MFLRWPFKLSNIVLPRQDFNIWLTLKVTVTQILVFMLTWNWTKGSQQLFNLLELKLVCFISRLICRYLPNLVRAPPTGQFELFVFFSLLYAIYIFNLLVSLLLRICTAFGMDYWHYVLKIPEKFEDSTSQHSKGRRLFIK